VDAAAGSIPRGQRRQHGVGAAEHLTPAASLVGELPRRERRDTGLAVDATRPVATAIVVADSTLTMARPRR
jgi:hypothetical protein